MPRKPSHRSYNLSKLGSPRTAGRDTADLVLTLPAADMLGSARRANPPRKKRPEWLAEADTMSPWSGYTGFVVRTVLLRAAEYRTKDAPMIHSSADIVKLVAWLRNEPQEHVCVVALGTQNQLLALHDTTAGTAGAAPVTADMIARVALLVGSYAVALVHNHPGGAPTPSQQDIDMTGRAAAALKCLGITLVDHIIIAGPERFVSFLDRGLISL